LTAAVLIAVLAGAVDWAGLAETPLQVFRHCIQVVMQADWAPPPLVHWLNVVLQVWEQVDAAFAWPAAAVAQTAAMTAAHT
jgi:hypothetical protein